jgi:lysozyme family protein
MTFDDAFKGLILIEKGYQDDPNDRGNWTSGVIGIGELKGTKYGISAMCLHPDTRVLKRDLTWARNGDLEVGDWLIGFSPQGNRRGMIMEPSQVLAINEIYLPAVRVITDCREIISSREHLWWGSKPHGTARNYRWMMSGELVPGDEIAKYRDPWETATTVGAGWLAGIIDGEACLQKNGLSIYQVEGLVSERIRRELSLLGISWSEEPRQGENKPVIRFQILGGVAQVLGMLRPERFLNAMEMTWSGKGTHGRYNRIETVQGVVDAGEQPVMAMITSTGTFIAEGLLSHNSYPHLDIKNLTLEKAKKIFKRDFWDRFNVLNLSSGMHFMLFDAAVNHGPGNAVRMLQRAINVIDDGHIGPVTIVAIGKIDTNALLRRFAAERLLFISKLRAWDRFGRGWVSRVAENLATAGSS